MRYVVIHHSAVDVDSTAQSIADYHVNTLGWREIGYHFRIGWSGEIDYVGDIETARANVYGRNHEVIGCCIPGDWSKRIPPEPALRSAAILTRYLLYRCPQAEVVGHYEIALPASPTSCPGATWPEWRERLR